MAAISLSPMSLTLIITAAAVVLLISGWVRPDLVGLLTAVALALSGVLTLNQALSGFSNPVVFVLISIFILTTALEKSGATAALGNRLAHFSGNSEARFVVAVMIAGAVLSLFMNTVAAAAVLLPPVLSVARRTHNFSPSRVLIPLAFSTLLGGTATLLTTANLVVSGLLQAHGLQPYGVLDFLPVGLPITIAGLAYMVFIGRHLLPHSTSPQSAKNGFSEMARAYRLREGLHAIRVLPNSPLIGRPAAKPRLASELGLTPVGLITPRGFVPVTQIPPERRIQADDVIVAGGKGDAERLALHGLLPLEEEEEEFCGGLQSHTLLAEVIPLPRGGAIGRTPQALRLRERYQALVVALWRNGEVRETYLYNTPLEAGDALLLLISPEGLEALKQDSDFTVLETYGTMRRAARGKMYLAVLFLLLALVPAAAGWVPLALSALGAAALALLVGLLPPPEAYRSISWEVIFLIGGMIPLGVAMRETGAAAFLSNSLLAPLANAPAWEVAGGFLLLTALLAQVTSGQVAALILGPLALAAATARGINPRGLGMAVAVGASFAFLLPTGHPVNLLVMAPGNYKPMDYFKVGLPLLIVVTPVAIAALQLFYL